MYLIKFRSQIDSYSYLPQFFFQSIHEYLILIRNIYREWACISLCFSKKKYIRVKKEKNIRKIWGKKKHILGIHEYFANTSHLTNFIPIPICKFWDSRTIPIPMCTEIGSTNLFLFLFVGKITIRWSLLCGKNSSREYFQQVTLINVSLVPNICPTECSQLVQSEFRTVPDWPS